MSKLLNKRGKVSKRFIIQITKPGISKNTGEIVPARAIKHNKNIMDEATITGAKKASKEGGKPHFKRGH